MNPKLLITDLFCGAGGTSTGFAMARSGKHKIAKVVACVNHDALAISSHAENHKGTYHFTEDIRTLDLKPLVAINNKACKKYPDANTVLWASLECTNFSKAKGGMPRNADSRTLAEHLFRYIDALQPDYIMIENVEEFMSWGPLDTNGKPVSRTAGTDYVRWCNKVQHSGYSYSFKILNSADFGAFTSRRRLFIVFAKLGLPSVFPEATHCKVPGKEGMFGNLKKWKAVKEVLDLNDHGNSIFGRKKDLSEKTLARIHAGLVKYVAGGKEAFIAKTYAVASNHHGCTDIDTPFTNISTRTQPQIVQPQFATPQYMINYHGKWADDRSIDKPAGTITTKDREALVSPQFIMRDFSSGGESASIDTPAGSVMPSPKMNLVTPIIVDTQFNNAAHSVEQPLPTITANRKHHYLMNPQYMNSGGSVDKPCFTLIARMDKAPAYLVTTEDGYVAIEVLETDSEFTVKIKEFMAMYGIVDIKMRMLKVNELLKIQGFPDDYVLHGSQADMKKFIGNSVVPLVVKAMAEALVERLNTHEMDFVKQKAA